MRPFVLRWIKVQPINPLTSHGHCRHGCTLCCTFLGVLVYCIHLVPTVWTSLALVAELCFETSSPSNSSCFTVLLLHTRSQVSGPVQVGACTTRTSPCTICTSRDEKTQPLRFPCLLQDHRSLSRTCLPSLVSDTPQISSWSARGSCHALIFFGISIFCRTQCVHERHCSE